MQKATGMVATKGVTVNLTILRIGGNTGCRVAYSGVEQAFEVLTVCGVLSSLPASPISTGTLFVLPPNGCIPET